MEIAYIMEKLNQIFSSCLDSHTSMARVQASAHRLSILEKEAIALLILDIINVEIGTLRSITTDDTTIKN